MDTRLFLVLQYRVHEKMAVSNLLWLLVMLSLCLKDVKSQQRFPYVSFRGQTLANHSYVDLSLVGDDSSGSDSVQCITDLSTCCSGDQGPHRGDWLFPNGSRLGFPYYNDIYEWRRAQRVDLSRRNNANSPVGIYRCYIATEAGYDRIGYNSVRGTVYVGLYTASGGKIYNNTAHTKCIHFCRRFVYMDICNNSILMTSENGSSYSVASLPVMASSQLSDLSLCLFPWSDSGQPWLCEPQSSGR